MNGDGASGSPIGDLVRAWRSLAPDDERTERRLAELLAPELLEGPRARPAPPPEPQDPAPPPELREDLRREQGPAMAVQNEREGELSSDAPLATDLLRDDETGHDAIALPDALPRTHGADSVERVAPLLLRQSSRALLGALVSTRRLAGAIDVPRLVERISQARPIEAIPRLAVRSVRPVLDVLVDESDAMAPFAEDAADAVERLGEIVGRSRLRVLRFEDVPTYAGPSLEELTPYEAPARGTPVLLLSDLGVAASSYPRWRGQAFADFGRRMRRCGCLPVALSPYPATRAPLAVRRAFTIVFWDRGTRVAEVARAVSREGGGLS
jgi:hypothetical protein